MPEQLIRDVVVPICLVSEDGNFEGLLGSGFLVGPENFLLTARHVAHGHQRLSAMVVVAGEWLSFPLVQIWEHSTEDIAMFVILGRGIEKSWLRLSRTAHHSAGHYEMWGYPEDVLHDFEQRNDAGKILANPDLVFTRGYIRRRFTGSLPSLRGRNFFELSEIAGAGCSGGPVVTARGELWSVGGIYVGERVVTFGDGRLRERSYALRIEDIADDIQAAGLTVAA